MIERVISLEVQKTYEELRKILLKNNCRVISEEPLKSIVVEHGYPSSFSPRESWKKISFYLFPDESGTRIVSASSPIFQMPVEIFVYLMIGFSALLLITFLLMSIYPSNSSLGNVAFIGLIVSTIIFEFYSYLYRKRDSFSEEVLKSLSQKQG